MNKKGFFKCLIFGFLLLGVCLFPLKSVQAANPVKVNLKANTKYTAYDVTGDKKNDTLYIKTTLERDDVYSNAAVSINGKVAYQFKNARFYEMKSRLYTLDNGKSFLYLYAVFDNCDGPVCGLFQYQSGKLKQVINFQSLMRKYGTHQYGEIVKMSGNKLYARFYIMSWSLGMAYVDYTYAYQSGTMKRTSNTGNFYRPAVQANRTFTANKTLPVYRSVNSSSKVFTLKKGNRVTISKCWVSGNRMYLQIKYKGKMGWMKALTPSAQSDKDKQFSDVHYAG